MVSIRDALELAVCRIASEVRELHQEGLGRETVGSVPGRPETEDVEIGIDSHCDEIFRETLSNIGSTVALYSEHGSYLIGNGDPEYLVSVDPFDGSGLYQRGIPAEWWSVASYFDNAGVPLGGVAVDIIRNEIYVSDEDGILFGSIERGVRQEAHPASTRKISDDLTIAAYLMDPSYLTKWSARFSDLVTRYPGLRIWPNGGASIYPWLARGLVDAYVMFDEPRSEIDPGIGFSNWSGIKLFDVGQNGDLSGYQFDPDIRSGRVPFFIAACTQDLAYAIVNELA